MIHGHEKLLAENRKNIFNINIFALLKNNNQLNDIYNKIQNYYFLKGQLSDFLFLLIFVLLSTVLKKD